MIGLTERFWSKVEKRGPDECWPWIGDFGTSGYGQINIDGKNVGAHRVAYWLATGESIDGFVIRHYVCDNPPCCNPAHLKRGTHQDNVADAIRKGRHVHPDWRLRPVKTHCKQGHPRDLYWRSYGCALCSREWTRKYARRIKEVA